MVSPIEEELRHSKAQDALFEYSLILLQIGPGMSPTGKILLRGTLGIMEAVGAPGSFVRGSNVVG